MDNENGYTEEQLREVKKEFPYRFPGFWTRQKNKLSTVIHLGSLVVTLTTLYFYYRSVSFEH